MLISVCSRSGRKGQEPRSFCLGSSRLFVTDILDRTELADARRFQVRVSDGRRFVIRHQPSTDQWELAAVYSARRRSPKAPAEQRARPLIALLRFRHP